MLEKDKVYNYEGEKVVYLESSDPQRMSFINHIKIGGDEMIEETYGSDKDFVKKNGKIEIIGHPLVWFYHAKPSNSFMSKMKSLQFQRLKSIYFNALEKSLEVTN